MKKIDIEKWDRNMPKLPENFFDEMQEKVLAHTVHKKEPNRFSLDWVISSAAVIALFIGFVFLMKNRVLEPEMQMTHYETEIKSIDENKPMMERKDIEIEEDVFEEKEILSAVYSEKGGMAKNAEKSQNHIKREQQIKERMEKILDAMNEEDFVDLAGNYSQDVYLELY